MSFFFKQWGDWLPAHQDTGRVTNAKAKAKHEWLDGITTYRVGKICAGRRLDGVEHDGMPVPF